MYCNGLGDWNSLSGKGNECQKNYIKQLTPLAIHFSSMGPSLWDVVNGIEMQIKNFIPMSGDSLETMNKNLDEINKVMDTALDLRDGACRAGFVDIAKKADHLHGEGIKIRISILNRTPYEYRNPSSVFWSSLPGEIGKESAKMTGKVTEKLKSPYFWLGVFGAISLTMMFSRRKYG